MLVTSCQMLDASCQMLGSQFFQPGSPTSAARSANSRHRATWLAGQWPSIYRAEKAGRSWRFDASGANTDKLDFTVTDALRLSTDEFEQPKSTFCENKTTILKTTTIFHCFLVTVISENFSHNVLCKLSFLLFVPSLSSIPL